MHYTCKRISNQRKVEQDCYLPYFFAIFVAQKELIQENITLVYPFLSLFFWNACCVDIEYPWMLFQLVLTPHSFIFLLFLIGWFSLISIFHVIYTFFCIHLIFLISFLPSNCAFYFSYCVIKVLFFWNLSLDFLFKILSVSTCYFPSSVSILVTVLWILDLVLSFVCFISYFIPFVFVISFETNSLSYFVSHSISLWN